MSGSQSRFEKTDYRKQNRSGNNLGTYQRSYSNKNSGGAAAAGSGPPPSTTASNSSFKKANNVQGGQSVANVQSTAVAPPSQTLHSVQHMGIPEKQHLRGIACTETSDAPLRVAESSSSSQRNNRAVPKAPSSQSPAMSSDAKSITPVKEVAAKPVAVQFGSISPGFVNGIQIPARTISAPPNLDEQKRNQARIESFRVVPTAPVPAVQQQQQQLPEKETVVSEQVHRVEPQSVSKLRKENQVSSAPSSSLPQKPSTNQMSGVPMQMPFHQQQLHLPYGVPNPPVPSQVVPGASMHIPLPMHYHMGNTPHLQHQMFMANMQPHLMQHQGLMHQGQGMGFPPQMGPHISHPLGNIGMNTPTQYPSQQPGNSAPPRKAIVITHPDTRKELKLDKIGDKHGDGGLPSIRAHPNVTVKSHTGITPPNLHSNTLNTASYSLSGAITQGTRGSYAPKYNPDSRAPPISGHGNPSFVGKVSISAPASKEVIKTGRDHNTQGEGDAVSTSSKVTTGLNDMSGQSPASVAIKGESAKGKAQGDAKQDVIVVDSGQASTKINQDSKCSDELSTVPSDTVAAATNEKNSAAKGSAGFNRDDDDSSKDQLKKREEKGGDLSEPSPKSHTSSVGVLESNELKEAKHLAHSEGEVTELKNELSTYSAEKQESYIDFHSDSSTYLKDNGMPTTESELSCLDNVESDIPEGSLLSDIPKAGAYLREREVVDSGFENVVSSLSVTGSKDILVPDQSGPRSASSKGKKKMKDILQKADAAGTTSDLYNAYKPPEEHKDAKQSPESEETGIILNDIKTIESSIAKNSDSRGGGFQSKSETDDWEDAADVASPKVGTLDNVEKHGEPIQNNIENLSNKYSRDFLLKFQLLNNDLPDGFSIIPSVANILLIPNGDKGRLGRNSYPNSGRHSGGGPQIDRHGQAMDGDNLTKLHGHGVHLRDHANSTGGSRQSQGGNFGVPRNTRQAPGQFIGSNHFGLPQSMNAMHKNNTEAEKWQRGSNFQRGLIPSPQTPSQLMHKAEKKYEIGKVADEEQAKQRRLKGILNKLTPQNFEKLFEQVKAVNIDSAVTLTGVISQIFDKALTEPTFCEMYADFCYHLSGELPDFSEENEKITFKRVLLNKCQEEFERGEREQEEADKSEDSEITQTKEEREERRVQARRRMLGNIRLIGELFKKKMLTERIMHECIKKLLCQHQNPDEEDLEALCKLMSTIGEMIDHTVAKPHMDVYFDKMAMLSNDMNLSSRVRFMLKDSIDLRSNKWQQRRKVEGPKKIEEVHRDAAHERQAQASRLARGPVINNPGRRGHPSDFGSRGSNTMPSPNFHSGNVRGYPSHSRAFGNHDIRSDDRQPQFESRTLRAARDDIITLGPQGGLGRGMFNRGSGLLANALPIDRPVSSGESRRTEAGYNGNNSVTERPTSNSSEDSVGRSAPERRIISATPDRRGEQAHSLSSDRELRSVSGSDKTLPTSPEKILSVERLKEMSSAAIKEFYSANDEKELILCISELNSPSFYPSMISLWVTDSFEQKDMHRDILTKLLINLSKPPSGILSRQDLLKGFEDVLTTLEDAATDAPKAPLYLGRILAKTITENIIPLSDISHIIHEGGEEPGTLLESGLAGDVLSIILESIQAEQGDSFLDQIISASKLPLQDFKSKKLEKFIK